MRECVAAAAAAAAHVKVTWQATAANQYRGSVGCVRSQGGRVKAAGAESEPVRPRPSTTPCRGEPARKYREREIETRAHPPLEQAPLAVVAVPSAVSLSTRSACCGTADSSRQGFSSARYKDSFAKIRNFPL